MNHRRRTIPLALLLLTLGACSASSERSEGSTFVGRPTLVRMISYRSGVRLELANESHTSRLELYSDVRQDASRKITTDEVMDELVKHFRKQGFGEVAQDGPAPAGGEGLMASLEVIEDGRPRSLVISAASTPRERGVFGACRDNFVLLYNQVLGLQAIDNPDGTKTFRTPSAAVRGDR